ncbi:hypothetical protein Tco_1355223 [Tanacetum coccineum]
MVVVNSVVNYINGEPGVDAFLSVWIWVRHPDDGGKGGECAGGAVTPSKALPAEGGDSEIGIRRDLDAGVGQ